MQPAHAMNETITVRRAAIGDETAISAIYLSEYGVSESGDDVDVLYPFPQFFEPESVRQALMAGTLIWLVAQRGREIVGTVGAVPNIGRAQDGIAEIFGLVVKHAQRRRGVAKRMLAELIQAMDGANLVLAETRIAAEGAWRTMRGQGFTPLGFEPFAHRMPQGYEPMIVLGFPSRQPLRQRVGDETWLPRVAEIAQAVVGVNTRRAAELPMHVGMPDAETPWPRFAAQLTPLRTGEALPIVREADGVFPVSIFEDCALGRHLHAEWADLEEHSAGVIGLDRLEGVDLSGRRYTETYFVARIGGTSVAYARVVWDHVDRRARILFMRTLFLGIQSLLVAAIVEQLEIRADRQHLVIVVDVRADYASLQDGLTQLGFFPTVFYPGMIDGAAGRVDAVQFTKLKDLSLANADTWLQVMDWRRAKNVVTAVIGDQS